MRASFPLGVLLLACWAFGSGASTSDRNLLTNGDFEKGRGVGPEGWQRPDELTTHWVESPGRRGKCIRVNTDVLASQFRDREDALAKAEAEGKEPPPPPRRKPTQPPKYDTVAGLDGVHYSSAEIPASADKVYKLEADVRVDGEASPKVWVKAYAKVRGRDRVLWKKSLNCEGAGKEWRTFRMVFPANTRLPAAIEKLKIQLYPYWPPATYYFDDVRLTEITEEELRKFEEKRNEGSEEAGRRGEKD